MANGITLQIHPLNDEQKIAALKMRADLLGIEISDNVAGFLLHNFSRDTNYLFGLLHKLDRAALAAKRKITIPFIKEIIGLN
jgi:DnaA family protein